MRVIARLDIKGDSLIKGVRFEGLRRLGNPSEFASRYATFVDELFLVDTVASLYGRPQVAELLESVASEIFVPLTVGGGVTTILEAERMFKLGADKVAINTAGFGASELFHQISQNFGLQSVVGSIQANRTETGWECMTEQGRERTHVSVTDKVHQLVEIGIGEIIVTSVDRDGTRTGFDLQLLEQVLDVSSVPVVIGGGCGTLEHLESLHPYEKLSGVALASSLHYGLIEHEQIRRWRDCEDRRL